MELREFTTTVTTVVTKKLYDCGSLIRCCKQHKGHSTKEEALQCRERDQRTRDVFRAIVTGATYSSCARKFNLCDQTVHGDFRKIARHIYKLRNKEDHDYWDRDAVRSRKIEYLKALNKIENQRRSQ